MNNKIECNIHNRFDIEVIDGATKEVKQKARAFNVVTSKLWEYLITTSTAFAQYIQYGTGSGTPSASDTSLFNRANAIAVTNVSTSVNHVTKLITRVVRIQLGLTTSNGITLTEVGLAAGSANGTLTTHAMLQDMNGNPITIAKTETDIINIYATIYCHWQVGSEIIFYPRGGLLNTLVGASNVLGSLSMGMNHRTYQCPGIKTWSKSGNLAQKKITYTAPRYSNSEVNISGVIFLQGANDFNGIAIRQGNGTWSKYHITGESVGTGNGSTKKFFTKFHYPENATVYINGVAQESGVTVKKLLRGSSACVMPVDASASDVANDRIVFAPYATTHQNMPVYNPDYQETGMTGVSLYSSYSYAHAYFYASNNLVNWTQIAYGERVGYQTTHFDVPAAYRNYKFFRCDINYDEGYAYDYTISNSGNIEFDTAPAEGDVITIDYDTACIPKDSDHVLDATVVFQFGEYNE